MKLHIKICLCTIVILYAFFLPGCASMQISGKNPIERAACASELLIGGKVSDSYIKVYKTEIVKAELIIRDMKKKAEYDNLVYADIADSVSDWIFLYNRVELLQKRYPDGLKGKKQFVRFNYIDYRALQKDAELKASQALYARASDIVKASSVESALAALPYLNRAKKYSNCLEKEIDSLAAETCFAAAEKFSSSQEPKTVLKAADYYAQADLWLAGYKDSFKKKGFFREKAARLYVEQADAKMLLQNYTAFRQAKESYIQAEKIVSGSASQRLSEVNEKLTVRLAIVYGGLNSHYPDEERVRQALQALLSSATTGPDNFDLRFVRESGRLSLLFADLDKEDIVLVPADNFGAVGEVYGPVNTTQTNVSKMIDGVVYTGTVIEQTQKVTVFFQNDTAVYDMRRGRNVVLDVFQKEAHRTAKTFSARTYQGDKEAVPANFTPGSLYVSGQYNVFFPNFRQKNDDYVPVTQSFGTLNETGKKLCWIISSLQYIPR